MTDLITIGRETAEEIAIKHKKHPRLPECVLSLFSIDIINFPPPQKKKFSRLNQTYKLKFLQVGQSLLGYLLKIINGFA